MASKRSRLINYALSGGARNGMLRLMTLTSAPSSPSDIHRSFRALKERIRRRWPFEYLAVVETTESGLKHLHIVYRGEYIPQPWLSFAWFAIHGASIVDVRVCAKGKRKLAFYLAKYFAKQGGKFWSSWGWVFRGWRSFQKAFIRSNRGWFARGLGRMVWAIWQKLLQGEILMMGGRWVVKAPCLP